MPARSGAVHVATTRRVYKGKTYVTHLLRRSIRKGKTVTHETLGNLSHLPDHLIEIIKRSLKGETFVPAAETFRITRSLPHGHVDAVLTMIRKLGVEELIASKRTRQRDLVIAMIAERLIFPSSKLAHTRHWHDTTLAEKLDIADATEDHLYDAMDWLLLRQKAIEKKLARRHLGEGAMVLYDVTSSYYEGKTCPLARFGYDRDGKTGCPIIVYGMLTDADGRPVAVQVYPGNTGDPKTVPDQVEALTKRFGLAHVVLVGDRGMLTQTQIDVLKKHPGLGWISALRSGAIRRLLADGHLVRKDLVSVRLAEITSPDFPGERLVACIQPALSTWILSLLHEAVSREVFMLSVINRLLVRRLLRPALISEQLCHVHLPSDLCQQACHLLCSQLPPPFPLFCRKVLRQCAILGRNLVRQIVS